MYLSLYALSPVARNTNHMGIPNLNVIRARSGISKKTAIKNCHSFTYTGMYITLLQLEKPN